MQALFLPTQFLSLKYVVILVGHLLLFDDECSTRMVTIFSQINFNRVFKNTHFTIILFNEITNSFSLMSACQETQGSKVYFKTNNTTQKVKFCTLHYLTHLFRVHTSDNMHHFLCYFKSIFNANIVTYRQVIPNSCSC